MTRFIDRGAIVAGWVGVGVAATVAISFLLVIPIEPIYWLLAFPVGLLIGYYADQRSDRRAGPGVRILANALYAGVLTAVVYAALLLGVKAIFFAADDGYRDASAGGPISCTSGADCVYQRYREAEGDTLAAAGITDATTFATYYWAGQWETAGTLTLSATLFGVLGAVIYGATRPRSTPTEEIGLPAA